MRGGTAGSTSVRVSCAHAHRLDRWLQVGQRYQGFSATSPLDTAADLAYKHVPAP
jgi:hypothetical protein